MAARVIAYASLHADMIGGGEHSLLGLMRGLAASARQGAALRPQLIVPRRGEFAARAERLGIDCDVLPMPPLGARSLSAVRAWRAWLKAHPEVALLHANNSRAAVYAGLAARARKIPMIFHCRICDRDPPLDWLIARLASAIIANSEATARRFAGFAVPVHVIYNGVEVREGPYQRPAAAPPGRLLLCVARLSRWKRHDLLLDVFGRLATEYPDAHLVCAGGDDPTDPAWAEELRRRAAALACGDRIHWLGQVDDVWPWYAASSVLVLPSRNEPFGRVLVEAMAAGLPVVAFRGGGTQEVLGDAGILVDDADGMARAIRTLFEDADRYRRLRAAGRERARRFSLDRHVQGVLSVYQGLGLPGGPARG